jgi:hypothetical protein
MPDLIRRRMEAQLAKLPDEQLQAFVAKSAPVLERVLEQSGGAAHKARAASGSLSGLAPSLGINNPKDHYNQTVRRGDRPMPSMLVLLLVLAIAFVLLRAAGWLG